VQHADLPRTVSRSATAASGAVQSVGTKRRIAAPARRRGGRIRSPMARGSGGSSHSGMLNGNPSGKCRAHAGAKPSRCTARRHPVPNLPSRRKRTKATKWRIGWIFKYRLCTWSVAPGACLPTDHSRKQLHKPVRIL
jgi:hypothetical protein